jgi:outer membrane receptor protein involved in Fe transport
VHGKGNFDLGSQPQFKSNVAVEWAMGRAIAGVVGRYVSSFDECSNAADPSTAQGGLCNLIDGSTNPFRRRVKSFQQVDLHAGYSLPSKLGTTAFFVGVNNVFDQAPPYVYSAPLANSDPLTYDFLGRYVYGRIQHRF